MAWTTPETAVAGDVLTAAWLNQNVRDNSLYLYQNTPQLIEEITLASTGAITFSNIPQTFSNLRLVCRVRASAAVTVSGYSIRVNSDTGNNYSFTYVQNANATVSGNSSSPADQIVFGVCTGVSGDALNFGAGFLDIPQYSATTTGYKVFTGGGGCSASTTVANSYHRTVSGQWHSTAAITSIQLIVQNATTTFAAGSYAQLMGLP